MGCGSSVGGAEPLDVLPTAQSGGGMRSDVNTSESIASAQAEAQARLHATVPQEASMLSAIAEASHTQAPKPVSTPSPRAIRAASTPARSSMSLCASVLDQPS